MEKLADWENHGRFILMLQPLGRWEGWGERQESHVSGGVELGFMGHAYNQNEHLREGLPSEFQSLEFRFMARSSISFAENVRSQFECAVTLVRVHCEHPTSV